MASFTPQLRTRLKICSECNEDFVAERPNIMTCSIECKKKRAYSISNEARKLNEAKYGKRYKPVKATKKNCIICDEPFETTNYRKKCCNKECTKENQRRTSKKNQQTKEYPSQTSDRKVARMKIDPKWLTRGKIEITSRLSRMEA